VLISSGITTIYLYLDFVMARYAFPPDDAGMYTQAGSIARIICFLTGPIIPAMFPKVADATFRNDSVNTLFFRSLIMSALMILAVSAFCYAFPGIPAKVLFGKTSHQMEQLSRLFIIAFAPVPLFIFLINFLMARQNFSFLIIQLLICSAYTIQVMIWHPGIYAVVCMIGVYAYLAFAVALYHSLISIGAIRKRSAN